jgi:hypothetical protein
VWESDNPFVNPEPGRRFVTAEVTVANVSGESYINAVSIDFDLQDQLSRVWDPTVGWREPTLPSVTLNRGQQVRGWITFELPVEIDRAALLWHPDFETTLSPSLP